MAIKTRAVDPAEKQPAAAAPKSPAKPHTKAKRKPKSKASSRAKPKKPSEPKPQVEAPAAPKPEPQPEKDGRDRRGERKLAGREAEVIEALRKSGGLKTAAAQMLKVARGTLYSFLDENPDIEEALTDIDEEIKDLAEGKMLQLLRAGDPQTIRWFLEMKAKDRGYARRVENTGKDGGPIETRQKPDLSGLSDEEIELLLRAAEKREQERPAGGK